MDEPTEPPQGKSWIEMWNSMSESERFWQITLPILLTVAFAMGIIIVGFCFCYRMIELKRRREIDYLQVIFNAKKERIARQRARRGAIDVHTLPSHNVAERVM